VKPCKNLCRKKGFSSGKKNNQQLLGAKKKLPDMEIVSRGPPDEVYERTSNHPD
jgi:hypothetical protein